MAIQRLVRDRDRIVREPGLVHRQGSHGDLYFETLHAGSVVDLVSHYLGDGESAYYAVAWNPTSGTFDQEWYASDRDPAFGRCEVDAPAHVLVAWEAEKARRREVAERERLASIAARDRILAEELARTPRPGAVVRVVRGRKVKIGLEGRVFWAGEGGWGPRAGIEFSDGSKEYVAFANLEVIEQPPEPRR